MVGDCYLAGVSTRRMDKLVKTLGMNALSKSQVRRMAAELDEHVESFRHRPLGKAGPFTFVAADALTMKVREGGRVVNTVVLLATRVNADGHREVLELRLATSEAAVAWNEFFADLVARSPGRGPDGHFRCPRRAQGCHRREPARSHLAALPDPLCGEPDGYHAEVDVAAGGRAPRRRAGGHPGLHDTTVSDTRDKVDTDTELSLGLST